MSRLTLRQFVSGTGVFLVVATSAVGIANAAYPSNDRLCANLTVARCNQYKSDLAVYTIAFANWNASIKSIDDAYEAALDRAQAERVRSMADADALPARTRTTLRATATRVYATAIRTAVSERSAALQALGPPPKRPVRP